MSTVKISALPAVAQLNANTSNTLIVGVDIPTGITGKITVHTLAQGLFSNEILSVGVIQQNLPNTIAQYSASGNSYIQTNLVNTNDGGSADVVITANAGSGGTDSTNFIDMGYANKSYQPGSEFNNIGTAISPLDGYLYVQGTAGSNGGNLTVGTTTSNTQLKFIVGGGSAANVIATITANSFTLVNTANLIVNTITTPKGSATNLVIDPDGVADVIFSPLTEVFVQSTSTSTSNTTGALVVSGGVGVSGNIYANAVYSNNSLVLTSEPIGQGAYNKANTGLANTAGVVTAGDFNISGNLTVLGVGTSGLFTINATSYIANTPAFRISGSANNVSQVPLNQGYMMQITGFANVSTRIVSDSFGSSNTTYSAFIGRFGRGTANTPSPVANGDILLRLSGNGYANSFSQFGQSKIDFVAAENFTDTTKGTEIQFFNTSIGSNTLNKIATFNANNATFTGQIVPSKGFLYIPRFAGAPVSPLTVDFLNDSVVKLSITSAFTINFTNYVAGKVVEVWVTNTAAGNSVLTHGTSALNSSVNATTWTIPGTSTVLVRYMSFNTDVANVYSAITHA